MIMVLAAGSLNAQGVQHNSNACDPARLIADGLAPSDPSGDVGSAQWICRASSPTQVECAYNVVNQNAYLHNRPGFSAVLKGCVEAERMRYEGN